MSSQVDYLGGYRSRDLQALILEHLSRPTLAYADRIVDFTPLRVGVCLNLHTHWTFKGDSLAGTLEELSLDLEPIAENSRLNDLFGSQTLSYGQLQSGMPFGVYVSVYSDITRPYSRCWLIPHITYDFIRREYFQPVKTTLSLSTGEF